jgi:CBS domain containing-hemolysin-like protein
VPAKRIRRLVTVFADSDLEDALATMRRSGVHLARVVDAEGETTGVLFLEDIIEELVGEVQDATRRA